MAVKTFDPQQVPGALNGGNPVVLTTADETTSQTVAYKNVPAGFTAPTLQVLFNMAEKTGFIVAIGPGTFYPALPAAAMDSGDFYSFIAISYQSSLDGIGVGPAVAAYATTPTGGPMTFSFPAPWSYSGPTPAALPMFDFTYPGFSGKNGLERLATLTWLTGTPSAIDEKTFIVRTTGNYLNGTAQVAFPDTSSLTGFPPAPPSGTHVSWSAEIGQHSYESGQTAPSSSTGSAVLTEGGYTVP